MPVALDRYYSRDEVLDLPEDGNRYELVHGELLVSPSPGRMHQRIVGRLFRLLSSYVEAHALGEVWLAPADISWGGIPDVTVQPDVFVEAKHTQSVNDWVDMHHFHLFAEVTSPTTARHDRFTKRRLYQEKGVPLYWVIDPDARRAEVWTPEAMWPVIEETALLWAPVPGGEPLRIELAELFAE